MFKSLLRRSVFAFGLMLCFGGSVFAQAIQFSGIHQIQTIPQEKLKLSPDQRKLDSHIYFAAQAVRGTITSSTVSAEVAKSNETVDTNTWGTFFGQVSFGGAGRAPNDYDGDGKTDIAVWRPSTGVWFVLPSGAPGTFTSTQWGAPTDVPVPGDYDGDGKTDIAVWRPSTGVWFVLPSGAPGTFTSTQWGAPTDVPVERIRRGLTPAILRDAFWRLEGLRPLTTLRWVNRYGNLVTSRAVAGEVQVIVDPAIHTPASIDEIALQHGGAVFAQLPAVGLYWIRVPAGQESGFIAALRLLVTDIFPNLEVRQRTLTVPTNYADTGASASPISVTSGNLVLDDFSAPACFATCGDPIPVYLLLGSDGRLVIDTNGNFIETTIPSRAAAHGHIVDYYRTNRYALYQTDTTLAGTTVQLLPPSHPKDLAQIFVGLGSMLGGSDALGSDAVINLSLGPIDKDLPTDADRQTANESFLESLAGLLNANVAGARSTLIIQAAGNTATDLTSVLVNQRTLHLTAAKQIIQVGALDASGQIASYSNFSRSAETMIYVPVTDTTNNGEPVPGTSFAAPQLQYLANQIRRSRPDLNAAQLWEVLFDPALATERLVQRPNAPVGERIVIRVIEDPFDPAVLHTALSIADMRFPPITPQPTFSLTIANAGGGVGTVAAIANPPGPGPTYPAGTVVTLTATPAAGSSFTGWSGDCGGSDSCVVAMNADKAVTATFSLIGSEEGSISITSVTCDVAGTFRVNGAASGPVGAFVGSGTGSSYYAVFDGPNTCSAWSFCLREPGEAAVTGFSWGGHFEPDGPFSYVFSVRVPIGNQTRNVSALAEGTCP